MEKIKKIKMYIHSSISVEIFLKNGGHRSYYIKYDNTHSSKYMRL